ncbi:MAG: YlbF family regulator [Vallitalea sp.]|nr:YlbF family regulator [Vallitalea sp.]
MNILLSITIRGVYLSIQLITQQLIQSIKQTPEYNNARKLKEEILRNKNLTKIVTDFQKEQERLYNLNLPPEELDREMKKLVDSFKQLSNNTIISDYSLALQQIQSIVDDINMSIIESIDKDLVI